MNGCVPVIIDWSEVVGLGFITPTASEGNQTILNWYNSMTDPKVDTGSKHECLC